MMNSDIASPNPPSFWSTLTPVQRWTSGVVLCLVALLWWHVGHGAVIHPNHQQMLEAILASQDVHNPEAVSSVQLWHVPRWEHLVESPLYLALAGGIHALGGVSTSILNFIEQLQWLNILGVFMTGWGLLRLMVVSGRYQDTDYQGWHKLLVLGCFFLSGVTLSSFAFPSPLPLFWACSIWTLVGLWRMDNEGWQAGGLWAWSALGAWACALLHPLGYTLVVAHMIGSLQQEWQSHHRQAYQWHLVVVLLFMAWLFTHSQGWHMPWQTPFGTSMNMEAQPSLTQWLMQGKQWLLGGGSQAGSEASNFLNLKTWMPKGFFKQSIHYLGQVTLGYQPSVLHGIQASFLPPQQQLTLMQTATPASMVATPAMAGVMGWLWGWLTPLLNGLVSQLPQLSKTFGYITLAFMGLGVTLGLYMPSVHVRRALWMVAILVLGVTLCPQVWLWMFPLLGFWAVLGMEGFMRVCHHAQKPAFRGVLLVWGVALSCLGLTHMGFNHLQHQEAIQLFYGGVPQIPHSSGVTALATTQSQAEGFSFSALDLNTLGQALPPKSSLHTPVVANDAKGFLTLFDWMRRNTHPYSVFVSATPSMLSLYGNRYAITYPPHRTPAFLADALLTQAKNLKDTHKEAVLYVVEQLGEPQQRQILKQALQLYPQAFHLSWESPELQMCVWQVH